MKQFFVCYNLHLIEEYTLLLLHFHLKTWITIFVSLAASDDIMFVNDYEKYSVLYCYYASNAIEINWQNSTERNRERIHQNHDLELWFWFGSALKTNRLICIKSCVKFISWVTYISNSKYINQDVLEISWSKEIVLNRMDSRINLLITNKLIVWSFHHANNFKTKF